MTRPSAPLDPVLDALVRAPVDDVPETDEERAAVAEAKADGRTVSQDEVEAALRAQAVREA